VTNLLGNSGVGATYDLRIFQQTGPCGTRPSLSVAVYNTMGGAAIAGIPVQVSSATSGTITSTTMSSGIALFPSLASDALYSISINASGYVPYSNPLSVGCVSTLPTQFVYLSPTVTPPILQVTPGQQTASATPGSKTIAIANAGSGTLNWTASILPNSTGFTSFASAFSGTGNASVTVNLSANETKSTRNAWVRVTAPGAQGSGAEVYVQQAGDTTPPVVALLGSNTVTLNVGQAYMEPGATASDAVSGDRTAFITTSGSVNPNAPGTYYLTYQAADVAGNVGSATRIVTVVGVIPEGVPVGKWVTPVLIAAALLTLVIAQRRGARLKQ